MNSHRLDTKDKTESETTQVIPAPCVLPPPLLAGACELCQAAGSVAFSR